MNLNEKIEKVKEMMKGKKIAIAFSGGADSTLITYLTKKVASDVLAITFDNGIMPSNFINNSKKIANSLEVSQEILEENLLGIDEFSKNDGNRCLICKKKMYFEIEKIATQKSYNLIIDGTNITDLLEDRPGLIVNYTNNIISPLVKAGITKEEVEEFLKIHNIEYSKYSTCLGTRISKNEKITDKKINKIKYAEDLIYTITHSHHIRVRSIQNTAQIELDNIEPLLNKNTLALIDSELKSINFEKITLDITNREDKKDIIIYKPCQDEVNRIMFENKLPYKINIKSTSKELEKLGNTKCSDELGIVMVDIGGKNVTIFRNGKIVARKVKDEKDAQDTLFEILPKIRREIPH